MWELDYKESWVLKNWCFWTVVLKTLEGPLDCKEIQPVHPKGNQSWKFTGRLTLKLKGNPLATWCEELTHLKRPWCWERVKVGGEGDHRGLDHWIASPTQWTWVWVNSRSWWWTGKLACCSPWCCKQLRLSDWTKWRWPYFICVCVSPFMSQLLSMTKKRNLYFIVYLTVFLHYSISH